MCVCVCVCVCVGVCTVLEFVSSSPVCECVNMCGWWRREWFMCVGSLMNMLLGRKTELCIQIFSLSKLFKVSMPNQSFQFFTVIHFKAFLHKSYAHTHPQT